MIADQILSLNSQDFFTPAARIEPGVETQQGLQSSAFEQVGAQLAVSFVSGPSALRVVDNGINSTTLMQTFKKKMKLSGIGHCTHCKLQRDSLFAGRTTVQWSAT